MSALRCSILPRPVHFKSEGQLPVAGDADMGLSPAVAASCEQQDTEAGSGPLCPGQQPTNIGT